MKTQDLKNNKTRFSKVCWEYLFQFHTNRSMVELPTENFHDIGVIKVFERVFFHNVRDFYSVILVSLLISYQYCNVRAPGGDFPRYRRHQSPQESLTLWQSKKKFFYIILAWCLSRFHTNVAMLELLAPAGGDFPRHRRHQSPRERLVFLDMAK